MIVKQNQIKFAIITPSFNQAAFLGQTLESVVSQLEEDDFYCVLDGGSIDDSVSILKKFSHNLEYVSEKDEGQADAINQGIARVTKWASNQQLDQQNVIFAYLNSDDYYLENSLAKVRQIFETQSELMWLSGDAQIVDEEGQEIQTFIRRYKNFFRNILRWQVLLILNPIPQPAVFIRLSAVQKVGNFNAQLHFTLDYEYWFRLWKAVGPPVIINQTLVAFRIHQKSKGTMKFKAQFAEQLQVARQFTQNQAWLFLQKLHNRIIILSYNLLK